MAPISTSAVIVRDYPHRIGEHCASTALRNLLAHQETHLSEGMIFGLASGLGFMYLQNDSLSPTRMFHGRTQIIERTGMQRVSVIIRRMALYRSVHWTIFPGYDSS